MFFFCWKLAIFMAATFQHAAALTNLTILAFVMVTGNEPRDGQICRPAMQIAVDAVNNNKNSLTFNYLRNYHVNVIYKDEGAGSNLATRGTINYVRTDSPDNVISPVIVGPYTSGGCQRFAAMIKYFDMVDVATGCSATMFSGNRRQFPNLYHTLTQAENIAFARVQFIKQVGHWDRVAILSSATNIRDVTGAVLMQDLLQQQGIAVPWFDAVLEVDSAYTLARLKESDLRVIVAEITLMDAALRFICASYKYGITGPNYLLIMQTLVVIDQKSDLPKLPPGCTKETLYEQMKYTIYVGLFFFSTPESSKVMGKTTFGYGYDEFESLLEAKYPLPRSSGDYVMRHICHDAMMQALLTLDKADRLLGQKFNLGLSDFQTGTENTKLTVFNAVNQSAASAEFVGLRVGKKRYSKRLEPDDEPLTVLKWFEDSQSFEHAFVIRHNESMEYFEQASYSFVPLKASIWKTADKKPPRSYPPTVVTVTTRSEGYSSFVIIVAGLLTVAQGVGFLVSIYRNVSSSKGKRVLQFFLVLGCFLANAAAIVFAQGNDRFCWLQIFFAVSAITVLNCSFLAGIFLFCSFDSGIIAAIIAFPMGTLRAAVKPTPLFPFNKKKRERRLRLTMSSLALLFTANMILLICWLGTDFPKSNSVDMSLNYNTELNVYEEEHGVQCFAEFYWSWIGAFGATNILANVIGCLVSYWVWHHEGAAKGLRMFTVAQLNMATLLGAVLLVTILIKHPIWQSSIDATAALIISAFSFGITVGRPGLFE